MVKYYMASKGIYTSSVKLVNCLIALVIMAIMGFAAIPSFLMMQANASKDKDPQSSGIQFVWPSSNMTATRPSVRSIHSIKKVRAQKAGARISRGFQKRVKYGPIMKRMGHAASKEVHFADLRP